MNLAVSIRLFLLFSLFTLLTACGSSRSSDQGQDLASVGAAAPAAVSSEKPIAVCNKAGSSTLGFTLMAQVSGSGYDPNYANLFLRNLPTGFEAGTSFIQFSKGQATSDTTVGYATAPIKFAIFDTQTSSYLNSTQTFTSLKWSDVQNLISGATAASFMNRVIFVMLLQDPNSEFQVLTAASYASSDNSVIEAVPALLPTFYANPADYAIRANGSARQSVLKNLHPFKNETQNFANLADDLCR